MEAHFIKDLGLDSLDVVEIIMAFEEELSMLSTISCVSLTCVLQGVDISDEEAEKIFSCQDAFELVKTKMDFS